MSVAEILPSSLEMPEPHPISYNPDDIGTVAITAASERVGIGVRAAQVVLRATMQEYLTASAFYRSIGAQTPSATYGGSRSITYMQMLHRARSFSELGQARAEYKQCHGDARSNHDEFGGLLRIMGYRLRHVPALGDWLEQKVREDDELMAEASFSYPDDCVRYSAPIRYVDDVKL